MGKKKSGFAPLMAAEGTGPHKRTPKHIGDKGRGAGTYNVEAIVGEAHQNRAGTRTQVWLVRWAGYDASDDTWEPITNLAGCEDLIGAYRKKRDEENAAALAKDEERRRVARSQTNVVQAQAGECIEYEAKGKGGKRCAVWDAFDLADGTACACKKRKCAPEKPRSNTLCVRLRAAGMSRRQFHGC